MLLRAKRGSLFKQRRDLRARIDCFDLACTCAARKAVDNKGASGIQTPKIGAICLQLFHIAFLDGGEALGDIADCMHRPVTRQRKLRRRGLALKLEIRPVWHESPCV